MKFRHNFCFIFLFAHLLVDGELVGWMLPRILNTDRGYLMVQLAHAENETPRQYIGATQQTLRADPAGGAVGNISANYPIKRIDVRGKWALIQVEAWVPVDSLVDAPLAAPSSAGQAAASSSSAAGILALTDYEVRNISKSQAGDTSRVEIKLKLKNMTSQVIRAWEGLLVVGRKGGPIIFRLPVSDDSQDIAPNTVAEVNFYWAQGEEHYDELQGETKDSLLVEFFRPKAR